MLYKSEMSGFIPWQPSTWPEHLDADDDFKETLSRIINETILGEIKNVMDDSRSRDFSGRGHVIGLAIFCAIDTISSYFSFNKKVGVRYNSFINKYFPEPYSSNSKAIYDLYRNVMTHSWNLLSVAIKPKGTQISKTGMIIGLVDIFEALEQALIKVLNIFDEDEAVRKSCLQRYNNLRKYAMP